MTDLERRTYSRHEAAALCAAGIWFENELMQIVLRHLDDLPVTDPSHRYLLTEVADECRHSTMFGEFIRRAGTPAYAPVLTDGLGKIDTLPGGRAMGYLLILAVEELLDMTNRATMRDERVHPVSRQIAKLHVLEEARHVSFAKTYLTELWPTMPADERAAACDLAPHAVRFVADLMVNDAVSDALGIEGGGDIARSESAPPRAHHPGPREADRLPRRARRHRRRPPPQLDRARPRRLTPSEAHTPARPQVVDEFSARIGSRTFAAQAAAVGRSATCAPSSVTQACSVGGGMCSNSTSRNRTPVVARYRS